jgi:two-component system CheB/CheR fusion protein
MFWLQSLISIVSGRSRPSARLAEALSGLPEAVALFDGEDRLLYCNAAFRSLYRIPAEAKPRGRSFAAILYTARLFEIAEEQHRDPAADEACERILACHGAANGQTMVLSRPDGRRVEFRALRTADGGTLTTRVETAGLGLHDETVIDFQSAYLRRRG